MHQNLHPDRQLHHTILPSIPPSNFDSGNPRNPGAHNELDQLDLLERPRRINHRPARVNKRQREALAPLRLDDRPGIRLRQPDMQRVLPRMGMRDLVVEQGVRGRRVERGQVRLRVDGVRRAALGLGLLELEQLGVPVRQRLHHRLHALLGLRVNLLLGVLPLGHGARHDPRPAALPRRQGRRLQIPRPVLLQRRRIPQIVGAQEALDAELGHAPVARPGRGRAAGAEGLPFLEIPHRPRHAEDDGAADRRRERALGHRLCGALHDLLVSLGQVVRHGVFTVPKTTREF
jgi:hypothetical protein